MAKLYPAFGARISTTVRFSSPTFRCDEVANFGATKRGISYTSFEGSENPTNAQSSGVPAALSYMNQSIIGESARSGQESIQLLRVGFDPVKCGDHRG